MRVGLFIPCYMDRLYPKAAMATLELLEKLGCEVVFPEEQTCCGQPMANSGLTAQATGVAAHHARVFADFDYVVCPSGSCTSMVRNHYHGLLAETPAVMRVRQKTFELCEFLHDVLKVEKLDASCPRKVGLHRACHGLRELRLGSDSERGHVKLPNKAELMLSKVKGLELVTLDRPDECCGFGGAFSVGEAQLSVKMGVDRCSDHTRNGAEVIASWDMSCLMHMEGILNKQGSPIRVAHIAEILNGNLA